MHVLVQAAIVAYSVVTCAASSTPVVHQAQAESEGPVLIRSTHGLVDFGYIWPPEATAVPKLAMLLEADSQKIQAHALEYAREDNAAASADGRPFHQHYLHKTWTTSGQSDRLLSLVATIESFTGGAHGNSGFSSLLWDREQDREVSVDRLLDDPNSLNEVMRAAYCSALDRERRERRQGEVLEGQFSECPKSSELVVVPADEDGDRLFDHLRFLASPYVAGPYAEGEYKISLPIPEKLVGAIKSTFRSSFEAQPQ